jgi:tRNA(fMet)-specific endonuclease VapC
VNYFLDTNVLIAYIRQESVIHSIQRKYNLEGFGNRMYTSSVCIGELKSIGIQNNWGEKKIAAIEGIKEFVVVLENLDSKVVDRYAEIDAFSQGRLPEKPLNESARNMGKNDLWIAATASILDAILITTDNAFQHLHPLFLQVAHFELKSNI